MDRSKSGNKSQLTAGNILYWSVGILFILTMLSTWLASNLFAKYIVNDSASDSAHVAAGGEIELYEHEPILKNGVYELDLDSKVTGYTYKKVIPGVDIAKDPFVKLNFKAEVDYELYMQVTKSEYFPETVTYKITDDWVLINEDKGIYRYKVYLDAATLHDVEIKILLNDKLYVSEHYVGRDQNGKDQEFSLKFDAWLKQVD